MKDQPDLRAVARQFQILGDFVGAEPYGTGHINDTYRVAFDRGGRPVRFIFQRINHRVFKNPVALMENIQRVTGHLRTKLADGPDAARQALTLIPAQGGQPWHRDAAGNYWRVYDFI